MIFVFWIRSLLRTTLGRMIAAGAGIALAVGLLVVLGVFGASASATMTQHAIENVPVDWQIEVALGADQSSIERALADGGAAKAVRPVEYASVDGFSASTGGTQQVTGAGKVIGIPSDYLQTFPGQVTLLSGSLDGPVLFSQTAANLHASLGDTVTIERPDQASASVKVSGIAAIPNVDSLFQAVGVATGLAPQSPPDNILIMSTDAWHAMFDAQRADRPDSARTQLHVQFDRRNLPASPALAFKRVTEMANNLEARVAGSAVVADNLAARLDGVRADALYARVLLLFLGAPGVVLATLVTAAVATAGGARRRRDLMLLRVRGASLAEALEGPAIEAALVGVVGAALGLVFALAALSALGIAIDWSAAVVWGISTAFAGVALALAVVLVPATRDARRLTVAQARTETETNAPPLWQRLGADFALLVLAGVLFWTVRGSGYQIVLAAEGVAQSSVNYYAFLAPLTLWGGLGLFWVRLSRLGMTAVPAKLNATLATIAGNLAPTVGASLSRQASRIARAAALLALAVGFAISTAIFNVTYDQQSRVDAELTNGADVTVTGSTADPAGGHLDAIRAAGGVQAAEPMMHRYAYVGSDLQDIYGIDPATIGRATSIANAYFANGDAKATLSQLAATPDGVLVSEETVTDFQLQPGDTVNLRLQAAPDNQYHPIAFKFVGIAREFPTAPKDSFLVANASYLAKVTAAPSREIVLVRTDNPASVATELKSALASHPALSVTALGEVRSLIASSLTAVSLGALAKLELVFGLTLILAVAGLVLGLGFVERQRIFSILQALGASTDQLSAFLWSEAALVTIFGLLFGFVTGFGVAEMLVAMLADVFDPPPQSIHVPFAFLVVLTFGALAAAAAVVIVFERVHRRLDPGALKPE